MQDESIDANGGSTAVYFWRHHEELEAAIASALNVVLQNQPTDPLVGLAQRMLGEVARLHAVLAKQ